MRWRWRTTSPGRPKYRDGVFQTLNYLLGRNPLNRSYVAGYGENAVQNVHHRFWARSLDGSLPIAPPGSVAGGPNRDLQDPVAAAQLAGCAQQRCYIDNIEAYSVNEVALNWNSSFAWLANWAAEKAGAGSVPPSPSPSPSASASASAGFRLCPSPSASASPSPSVSPSSGPAGACRVTYTANSWNSGFTADVTVVNTSTSAWNGWTLKFSFANGQTVTQAWSGTVTQSGAQVTATNAGWNGNVGPGASANFGFNGTHSGTNPNPAEFSVNGATCS